MFVVHVNDFISEDFEGYRCAKIRFEAMLIYTKEFVNFYVFYEPNNKIFSRTFENIGKREMGR